ncbi:MAG: short-chain dehydrogenase [Desulfobacteraceae bacterium 4572_87]|nr:MAG: short-chain dehydrogenase [Desulfobacteraceae bacterium 4572_87]
MALNMSAVGEKIGPLIKEYTWKDVVLYALGVGAGFDELEYVWEDNLKAIPSFSIAGIFEFLAETAIKANVDLSGILHGEQDIIFHHPIPPDGGTLTTEGEITRFYDKGTDKGALVIAEADTFHSNGQKLFTNAFSLFCRKDGGFGGETGPTEGRVIPERDPDYVEEDAPSDNQPLLYRMSGDIFALHVNPDMAKASGFEKPIMHGLCTHGYACRAVIKHLMPGEPERMTRFRVRFSKPLYPGVPIQTLIWKEGDGKANFQTVNAETGEVILDLGVVEWMGREEKARREGLGGIHFDGRVAVVTGAGAGLGRAYALELARRGAKVLVNDLGGTQDGTGKSASAADNVVKEIVDAGGEATSNYDSVTTPEGGENIVNQAVKTWGRVDILINNAGILRDKTLAKMAPAMWDAVLDVHLKGAYNVTRPAFLKMREQRYGRVVLTTSAAGLYGNFGQTNYSAAKLGLVGFMNTLKIEGERAGIKVNTVAPIAGTRMTEEVLPPDLFEKLKPEFVTPLVLYLASEQCPVTGTVYNAGGGYYNRVAVLTGQGKAVGDGKLPPTPEQVAGAMKEIKSMADAQEFQDATRALTPMLDAFDPAKATPKGEGEKDGGLTVTAVFEQMPEAFQADAAAGVDVIFQFNILGPGGGEWHAEIQDGTCGVAEGRHEQPTTTIKMNDEDFIALMSGKLNPMSAFTSGKLKIEGDIMKSQLIEKLFKF